LRETLAEGVANGETIRNLADRIETVFDDAKGRRARIIARTETVRAANFGTDVGFRQAGVPKKQWLSSRDAAVRDSHAIGSGLDGQTISTGGMFKSPITGAEAPYPGAFGIASEDINCRCIEVAVFEESDIRDYSEEQKIAMWKYFEANRMTHERNMIAAVRRGFDKQEEAALAALRGENEA
jgi:SPP1 gp7 family putative phage head morphogenesis protein